MTANDTVPNPVHVFNMTGHYTVTLTVIGPGGSNTTQKISYINVTLAPTPTPTPTPKPSTTPKPSATHKPSATPRITPTPAPTPVVMPTVPPDLWPLINQSMATATPLPPPPQGPTPGPTLVPLPSQEPSPAPTPAGRDHVPGLVAFAGFNLLVVSLYASISYLFFRR